MENLFSLFYQTSGVCTDTRNIFPNSLFIGLKGGNFDGSLFAKEAIKNGAKFAIVEDKSSADHQQIFYVPDTLRFLQLLALHHRRKFNIPIIAITGTNGKTTTKELMASVLSQKFDVHYTQGNLNNHIGVPLTLLQLNNSFDMAIIEMGANKPGDIEELVEITEPTHGIITNIGLAHLEGFGSPEGVLKTKCELYDFLSRIGGTVFVNDNESKLLNALPNNVEVVDYGCNDASFLCGEYESLNPYLTIGWKHPNDGSHSVTSNLVGAYNTANLLAAICIGVYFEIPADLINKGVSDYVPTNNRSQVKKTTNNTLILDAYNANPTSVQAAIDNMIVLEADNKLLILGDMLELGSNAEIFHEEILNKVNEHSLSALFVGHIYASLKSKFKKNMIFSTVEEVKEFLAIAKPKNNFILLKGSRGIGLERLLDVL